MDFASLLFALVLGLSGIDARGINQVTLPGRTLQQTNLQSVTRVRVVNFATLPDSNDQIVDETELKVPINVTASDKSVMFGAYYLGPDQVRQLNYTIATELVRSSLLPGRFCAYFAIAELVFPGAAIASDCDGFSRISCSTRRAASGPAVDVFRVH